MSDQSPSSDFALKFSGLSFEDSREFQESCNGLVLLCQSHYETFTTDVEEPGVENSTYRTLYDYYVVNPLTKQYVVIAKPKPNSGTYNYAGLVYHPAESSHFKMVRFRDRKSVV